MRDTVRRRLGNRRRGKKGVIRRVRESLENKRDSRDTGSERIHFTPHKALGH